MNNKNFIIVLFILITLLYFCSSVHINTRQSQEQSKKRYQKKLSRNPEGIIRTNKKRRRMDDEDDEDIDPTLLVYNRCDHGHTPDDISDCTKYDTEDSSCCIYTYGQDTGCVLIGFKYLGSKSVGDMTVNCYNKYLKSISLLWIIVLFFIFIN